MTWTQINTKQEVRGFFHCEKANVALRILRHRFPDARFVFIGFTDNMIVFPDSEVWYEA